MITNHKIRSITTILESADSADAISIVTTDDATYTEAANAVSVTVDVNGVTMASTELTELKSIIDALVAAHESLVGLGV
jgi:hypothetical protein